MKYGLTLFCDEQTEFKADQIALVDRVIESFDDVSQLRSRSVCARNVNDMLQVVRSSHSDIATWCQFFTKQNKPVYAYVLCGLSELKGGGSSYWNERWLECLIVELQTHGYEVVLVTGPLASSNSAEQKRWLKTYRDQCKALATKHSCDTLPIRIGGNRAIAETCGKRIAKDLKDRYADTIIERPIEQVTVETEERPIKLVASTTRRAKRRLRQSDTKPFSESKQVKREEVKPLAKESPKANTEQPKVINKPKRKRKTSTVKIERF